MTTAITQKTYGIYEAYNSDSSEKNSSSPVKIQIKFQPLDLLLHWKRCSMAADFFSSFLSENFTDKEKCTNVMSTIINELVENAAKYTYDRNEPIHIDFEIKKELIVIEVISTADNKDAMQFDLYLKSFFNRDIHTLYFDQLEQSLLENKTQSGLGLLTLKKDYNIEFGFKIQSDKTIQNLRHIHVMTVLNKKEVEQL